MKIDKYFKLLTNCDLFFNISLDEVIKIFDKINYKIIKYNKNSIIHNKNEVCENLIIILSGTLSLYEDNFDNNKIFTVYNFSKENIIGANTLFAKDNNYKLNIICKTDCTLLYIHKDVIFSLISENPIILKNFLYHVSKKAQNLLDKIYMLSSKSLRSSIVSFLNKQYKIQHNNRILLNITKTELATYLAVERTSLSRELQSMKKDKLIDYDRNSITILDYGFFKIE